MENCPGLKKDGRENVWIPADAKYAVSVKNTTVFDTQICYISFNAIYVSDVCYYLPGFGFNPIFNDVVLMVSFQSFENIRMFSDL